MIAVPLQYRNKNLGYVDWEIRPYAEDWLEKANRTVDDDKRLEVLEHGLSSLPEDSSLSGGVYGSHFLYMLQGGYNEEQKRLQTRMYGTQGTHFLTNLISNNVIYGYIAPTQDTIDPWFFSGSNKDEVLRVLTFPKKVKIYADSKNQRCIVTE